MSKFYANDPLTLGLTVRGSRVYVPGIAVSQSHIANVYNRLSGAVEPTEVVDALTFHRLDNGHTYYQRRQQPARQCEMRTVACEEIDELTGDDLLAAVEKSLAELDAANEAARAAVAQKGIKPKANFGALAAAK